MISLDSSLLCNKKYRFYKTRFTSISWKIFANLVSVMNNTLIFYIQICDDMDVCKRGPGQLPPWVDHHNSNFRKARCYGTRYYQAYFSLCTKVQKPKKEIFNKQTFEDKTNIYFTFPKQIGQIQYFQIIIPPLPIF